MTETGGAASVLVVDDEDLVRMATVDMLTEAGYEVSEAGSAQEALAKVRAGLHFDVLVTDHLMPGMRSTELIAELRSVQPDFKALVISGYVDIDDAGVARLSKPFTETQLVAKVRELEAR